MTSIQTVEHAAAPLRVGRCDASQRSALGQMPLASLSGLALLLAVGCGGDAAPPSTTGTSPITGDQDSSVASHDASANSGGNKDQRDAQTETPSVQYTPGDDAGSEPAAADAVAEPTGDAGPLPATGKGKCDATTPHGCYVAQPDNNPMCPAQSPEQSASYPPQDEWKGCNGIQPAQPFGLDPKASCSYRGPNGELATCVCDTGLHWLCSCGTQNVGGIGQWPACTP